MMCLFKKKKKDIEEREKFTILLHLYPLSLMTPNLKVNKGFPLKIHTLWGRVCASSCAKEDLEELRKNPNILW